MAISSLVKLEKLLAEPEDDSLVPAEDVYLTKTMRFAGIIQTLILSATPCTGWLLVGYPSEFWSGVSIVMSMFYGLPCAYNFFYENQLHFLQDPFGIFRRWHSREIRKENVVPMDTPTRYKALLGRVHKLVEKFKLDSLGKNSPIGKARADIATMFSVLNKTKGRCFVYETQEHPLAKELRLEIQQTEEFLAKVSASVEAEVSYIEAFCGALDASVINLNLDAQIEEDIFSLRHARDALRQIDAITIPESRTIQSSFLVRLSTMVLALQEATNHAIASFQQSDNGTDILLRAQQYVKLEEPTRAALTELTERLSEPHLLSLSPSLESPEN